MNSFEYGFFDELGKLAAVYKPKTLNEPVQLVSYKDPPDLENPVKRHERIKSAVSDLPDWRKANLVEMSSDSQLARDELAQLVADSFTNGVFDDSGSKGASITGGGLGVLNIRPGERGFENNWRDTAHHEAIHSAGVDNELVAHMAGGAAVPRGVGFYHPKRLLGGLMGLGSWLVNKPYYPDIDIFGNYKDHLSEGQSSLGELINQWKLYRSGGVRAPK